MAWSKWSAPARSRLLAAPSDALRDRLGPDIERAAARRRRTLVSATVEVEGVDPCAVVFASRLASDRWFCWEQQDRDFALATLGVAHEASSRGAERFRDVASACFAAAGDAILSEPPGLPAGAGPVWAGGFAFDPEGGGTPPWSSLQPAALALPELSICATGARAFLTVNALVSPGEDPAQRLATIEARLAGLRAEALPMVDPHPTGHTEIHSARPPGDFERTVA